MALKVKDNIIEDAKCGISTLHGDINGPPQGHFAVFRYHHIGTLSKYWDPIAKQAIENTAIIQRVKTLLDDSQNPTNSNLEQEIDTLKNKLERKRQKIESCRDFMAGIKEQVETYDDKISKSKSSYW